MRLRAMRLEATFAAKIVRGDAGWRKPRKIAIGREPAGLWLRAAAGGREGPCRTRSQHPAGVLATIDEE